MPKIWSWEPREVSKRKLLCTASKCWARKKVFLYVFINGFVSNFFQFICSRTKNLLSDALVITLEVVKIEKIKIL